MSSDTFDRTEGSARAYTQVRRALKKHGVQRHHLPAGTLKTLAIAWDFAKWEATRVALRSPEVKAMRDLCEFVGWEAALAVGTPPGISDTPQINAQWNLWNEAAELAGDLRAHYLAEYRKALAEKGAAR